MESKSLLRVLLVAIMVTVFSPLMSPATAGTTDGTPDTAFTTNTGTGFDNTVYSVAVQPDRKIIVGGNFNTLNNAPANYIARLNADGTPDTAFTTNTGTGFDNTVYSVAVQSDGKIIVGGHFTALNNVFASRIAQLNADGTPDISFSDETGTGFNGTVYSIAMQSDGKIIVGGSFTTLNGVTAVNRIARLNADGTPDISFSDKTGTGFNNTVLTVAVQSDGKIIVGGVFTTLRGVTANFIARLNADGTPDISFSDKTGTGFNGTVYSIAVQSDGKIIVGGSFIFLDNVSASRIARLNADGTPDISFSVNTGTGFNSEVYAVAVQSDGKIVAGGIFTALNGTTVNFIARLDGSANTPALTASDLIIRQALPLPASGNCNDITQGQNTFASYGTSVSGGWIKSWEPWVNETLDTRGERIGGYACMRYLINTGGNNWRTTNTIG